jgi:predicted Zn-dependent peptidase
MNLNLVKPSTLNSPTITKLSNGLTIIAEQMPVDAVNLNVWFNVGSTVESDHINGMAHFLEHMIFKGTPSLENGEFERLVEQRGAITNAATSQEYTHFYLTSAPKDFADLAPLQLDLVLNPIISEEDFHKERLVVLEEIRRSEDNPRRRNFYRAMETCFANLPYRRPVLGPSYVIENLKAEQMRDFHGYWYQPQSMTVVVVGNLPVDDLTSIVAEAITKNNSTPEIQRDSLKGESPFQTVIRYEYDDPSLKQARLVMMWRVPGMQELWETYPLDVLAAILGQGKMSRLFRDLREDRQLVSRISVSNITHGVQGVFSVSAQLPTENIPEVEKAIAQHILKVQIAGIAESELNRICTKVANHFIFSSERPSDRAHVYGYYYSQLGDLEPALNYPDYIKALTVKDIQKVAQQYLSADAYGIVISRPKVI